MKNQAINKIPGKYRRLLRLLGLCALYCIILFLPYAQYYADDMVPMSGDGLSFIGDQIFVKQTLAETGEFPIWNKWLAAGVPFSQISPTLLFSFLPVKAMVYAIYIVPVALGALFAYLYFREIKCSVEAALSMSTVYLLSIHLGGFRKGHGYIILASAVLPVILYFVERYFTTQKLRWLIGSSVAMAAQFYLGSLQHTFYADCFLIAYLLAFGVHYRMKLGTMLRHGVAWGMSYAGLIAFRIIPMLEQNLAYADMGSARTDYDTFVSYSIHPIKLIEMVFPKFFWGDAHQAFGPRYSSEMDVEIFWGYMVFLLVIAGVAFCIRDFRVRFYLAAMGVVFLYCALGAFPAMAQVIYQIPYLGDFRCPARALYLFIFMAYTLAAIGLSTLKDRAAVGRFLKLSAGTSAGILAVVAIAVFTAAMCTGISGGFTAGGFQPLADYVRTCLGGEIVWVLVSVLGIVFGFQLMRKYPRWGHSGICLVAGVAVIAQTLPFTSATQPSKVSALNAVDEVSAQLASEIGNGKVWDAFLGIDAIHESIISLNRGASKGIASINTYAAFNNPRLYRLFTQEKETPMNSSGLLSGSLKAVQNVRLQNSLLSMLGVGYIIDSSQIIAADSAYYQLGEADEVQYTLDALVIPDTDGELAVQQDFLQPAANAWYQVSFSCDAPQAQTLIFDLYAGPEYDAAEQEAGFTLQAGDQDYSALIHTGDCDAYTDIVWRILSFGTEEFTLRDFTIAKLETIGTGAYTLWNPELASNIYVNENARDILYIPDAIVQIADTEMLYEETPRFSLDRVNYMEDLADCTLYPEHAVISGINFGSNRITAQIETEEDTFVNFSQCHYPGWKAYVDGAETELHLVNGLIMGMEVPAGTHEISFSYEPLSVVIGLSASGGTAALLVGLAVTKRKERCRPAGQEDGRKNDHGE